MKRIIQLTLWGLPQTFGMVPFWLTVLFLLFFVQKPVLAIDHTYTAYDALLRENVVVDGPRSTVRYGNIQKTPQAFYQFIREIESVTQAEFLSWTTNQKKAFLIVPSSSKMLKIS